MGWDQVTQHQQLYGESLVTEIYLYVNTNTCCILLQLTACIQFGRYTVHSLLLG